jgi:hypothetical protein
MIFTYSALEKSCYSPFFLKGYEGDPLSPQEGEAPQGEHPLDPIFTFFPYLKRISRQPPEGHRSFYECLSGAGGKGCRSLKERQNNFPMISIKPRVLILKKGRWCKSRAVQSYLTSNPFGSIRVVPPGFVTTTL